MTRSTILLRKVIFLVPALLLSFALQDSFAAEDVPSSKVFKGDYATVWKATMIAVAEGGMSVQSQDKETGFISTDWYVLKQPALFSRGWQVRGNVVVKKKDKGSTEVIPKLVFQNKIGDNEWRPASDNNTYAPKMNSDFYAAIQKNLDNK